MRAFTDKELLAAIRRRTREYGYPPSIRELADDLGVLSSETVHSALVRLREQDRVNWVPNTPRTLRVTRKTKTK